MFCIKFALCCHSQLIIKSYANIPNVIDLNSVYTKKVFGKIITFGNLTTHYILT